MHDLSLNEQKLGYRFVDGRPIYRKTYSIGGLPNATVKNIPHGLPTCTFIHIDPLHSFAHGKNSGMTIPMNFPSTVALNMNVMCYVDSTNIVLNDGYDRTSYNECYVTLIYAKLGDTSSTPVI